ncbi:endonuclease/exonuclease/phosphatase family protein [uncultured Sphingomonas sp.]|uniref:endonuclease/exonuclease/phosphatase family protein n=1 Tax=uncultured Sphingomonas sp. TaxID=158754 RepID=UPI0035CB3A7C
MIKVASYNIHKAVGTDRIRNPERILAVLHEIDADIVALQEADRRFGARAAILSPHHLADHSPWKAVSFGTRAPGAHSAGAHSPGARALSAGWHGNVLLVRKTANVADCAAIHLPTLEPRGAICADIALAGATMRVVGMHLDLSGLWRRRQARAVLAHLDGKAGALPTIMMGDLNEWSRAAGCLGEFTRRFALAPTGPSFHSRRPVARLDRIMTSPDLRVVSCGVHMSALARQASDHLPIWATIERR